MDDPLTNVRSVMSQAEDIDDGGVKPELSDAGAAGDIQDSGPGSESIGGQPPAPTDDEFDPVLAEAAALPLNDIGNGKRFLIYHGQNTMKVPRIGWFVWTGTHWKKDEDNLRIRGLAQTVSSSIHAEAAYLPIEEWQQSAMDQGDATKADLRNLRKKALKDRTEEDRDRLRELETIEAAAADARKALRDRSAAHRRHAKATGNTGKIDAMLTEAAVPLARPLDHLDADPLVLNCLSGSLRFETVRYGEELEKKDTTVTVYPHLQDDLISKCIPARYDPRAKSKLFDDFITRILPDREIRTFVQRWFGLSASGIPVQMLAFLFGHGANGKSVLVDLICRLLDDYAATAPIEALTGQSRRGGSDATPELIPLIGARAVRASEPEQGERFKEGMIKALTGGEPIPVRALHSDFVFIKPFFKLTISGNHKPEIRGTDDGIWRRVLLVPFDVQIPESERDPDLGAKLWEERDAVLTWLVDGLTDYLDGGLRVPSSVSEATDGYRKESDPVGTFLTECTDMTGEDDDFTSSKDLIEGFNFWMESSGETKWGGRATALRLKEKCGRWRHPETGKMMATGRRNTAKGYRGVRFTSTFAADFYARHQGKADDGY